MNVRTQLLLVGTGIILSLSASAQIIYKAIEGDPVRIDSGQVAGTYLPSGVRAYFGVPFAAPPVRGNRWREPQPVAPWSGVLTADRMAPECLQSLRSSNINHYFGEEATSEDCLYLNLWAPARAHRGDRLPVVVWIYGGGYSGGSSSMAPYSGEPLARKGVIVVGFNYRVGVLGFLAHPEATAESVHHASGDYGFLDQVAALSWIQRNIAAFGGDAHNITLVGQSAGSMSISFLQASPLAHGLFQKAFGMSGSALAGPGSDTPSLAQGEEQGTKLQAALKLGSLAQMRFLSGDKVLAVAQAARYRPTPIIDGYFLPDTVPAIFAAHAQNDVAVVAGSTANDIGTNVEFRRTVSVAEFQAAAQKSFGAAGDEFLRLFPATDEASVRIAADQVGTGSGMGLGARAWVHAQNQYGHAPAYLFLFARVQPYAPGIVFADHDPSTVGAYHTGDVPYWLQTQDAFNLFRQTRNWTAYDRELANTMSDVLVNFAKSGKPRAGDVSLVRYDPADEQRVVFGNEIHVERINTPGMDFLAAHPLQFALAGAAPAPATPSAPAERPTY